MAAHEGQGFDFGHVPDFSGVEHEAVDGRQHVVVPLHEHVATDDAEVSGAVFHVRCICLVRRKALVTYTS